MRALRRRASSAANRSAASDEGEPSTPTTIAPDMTQGYDTRTCRVSRVPAQELPPSVSVFDVGPRDGLQNEPDVLEPAVRAELVRRLAGAGLPGIEVASFVDPRRVPQMGDAEEVVEALDRAPGIVYAGLVLNERGYERLVAAGLDEVRFAFGATESFNRRNQNASVEESLAAARRIAERARADGIRSSVTISVAFGCPFEGRVDEDRVLELAETIGEARPGATLLADTIGVATPAPVRRLVTRVAELGVAVGGHFHNTRNTGYANALAALEAGATILDSSVGGLGGCPFAPRATGNIATEDLVYLLAGEGVESGIDLGALVGVSEWLEGVLGRPLDGQVYRAGVFPA
jgi:isopropylmalate/homocitrate/citramalate synthase